MAGIVPLPPETVLELQRTHVSRLLHFSSMRTPWLLFLLLIAGVCLAQQEKSKPEVKINYINVCAPSPDEQKQLAISLERIPTKPDFSGDFEISRGRTTASPESLAMASAALPGNVQQAEGASSVSR